MADPVVSSGGRSCWEDIHGPPPGQFLVTTHGSTHYRLEGKETDPLIILQHGIGSHTSVWDDIANDLVIHHHFRVLRYDFYDRGYSESDKEKYPITTVGVHPLPFTVDVYVQQLHDVLSQLGLNETPFIHCGHSLGGLLGFVYAASTYPLKKSHIKGLILIDAVCLPATKPLAAYIADLPFIGNLIVKYLGAKTFLQFLKGSVKDPNHSSIKSFLDQQSRMVYENSRYFASIRSTNANCKGFIGSAESEFRTCCSSSQVPIHFIWGKDDTSIPYQDCITLKQIATELGTPISELSFEDMPHNVFFPDAKPKECQISIREFCQRIFQTT